MNWKYNTIIHEVAEKFNLSHVEYCIMDTITRLASNASNSFNGWCNASNSTIAKAQRVTPQYVSNTCTKLVKIGLMQTQENSNGGTVLRRATALWCNEIDGYFQDETKFKPIKQSLNPLNKVDDTIETKFNAPIKQSLTNNTTYIIDNNNTDSKIDILPTPTVQTPIEQLGKTESLPNEKTVYLSANEINKFVCPDGVNNGLFMLLRKFASNRAAKKAKAHKITERTWETMLNALKNWAKIYSPDVLLAHLTKATEDGCTWISPFYSEVSKTLDGIQRDLQKLGQNTTVANIGQIEPQPTELPFANAKLEKTYKDTLARILELFPALPNTKISNLTRVEFLDIFVTRKEFLEIKLPNFRKFIAEAVTDISIDGFAHKIQSSIGVHINKAIKSKLRKIEEAQNG